MRLPPECLDVAETWVRAALTSVQPAVPARVVAEAPGAARHRAAPVRGPRPLPTSARPKASARVARKPPGQPWFQHVPSGLSASAPASVRPWLPHTPLRWAPRTLALPPAGEEPEEEAAVLSAAR